MLRFPTYLRNTPFTQGRIGSAEATSAYVFIDTEPEDLVATIKHHIERTLLWDETLPYEDGEFEPAFTLDDEDLIQKPLTINGWYYWMSDTGHIDRRTGELHVHEYRECLENLVSIQVHSLPRRRAQLVVTWCALYPVNVIVAGLFKHLALRYPGVCEEMPDWMRMEVDPRLITGIRDLTCETIVVEASTGPQTENAPMPQSDRVSSMACHQPRVPTRAPDRQRWQLTWRKIRVHWQNQKVPGSNVVGKGIYLQLKEWLRATHPDLACTERTMREIIAAGERGELDW